MTHRRQTVRQIIFAALNGSITATVVDEQAKRSTEADQPLVIVTARAEAIAEGGTMGEPADERELTLAFEIHARAPDGRAAADAVNALCEQIAAELGTAFDAGGALDGQLLDLRWASFTLIFETEQDAFVAIGTEIYTGTYQADWASPT